MNSTYKLTKEMTMITHSIVTEFFITDVTKSRVIIIQFMMNCHYHTFCELTLFINFLDVLFKCLYKCLRIIVKFFYKSNWMIRIECIVKALYMVTKYIGDVFLILLGVTVSGFGWHVDSCGAKDSKSAYTNKWDSHWPTAIFKRYFRSLFGKFNFYCFVWFTILMRRCYWFIGIESIQTSNTHMSNMTMFLGLYI